MVVQFRSLLVATWWRSALHRSDSNGEDSGHVRIYDWSGGNWLQRGEDIRGEAAGRKPAIQFRYHLMAAL